MNRRQGLAQTLALLAPTAWAPRAIAADPSGGLRERLGPLFIPDTATAGAARQALRRWASPDAVRRWNDIAVDTSGVDHTPVAAGESRNFGEQLGPGRSSRAMAIVHIAMFDALVAIVGGYDGFTGLARVRVPALPDAAVAQAAHDALVAMYPSQAGTLDELLAADLARHRIVPAAIVEAGVALGRRAAEAIVAQRADDGAQHAEPKMGGDYVPGPAPGEWRQDPISQVPIAMGAHWGAVRPFVLRTGSQFRLPSPPALASAAYAAAFDEVKRLGGDGIATATSRTEDQTRTGLFWAYDGTPSLCAPPRLYNQIAMLIADQRRSGMVETARLLALVNVAMADAGIAAWDSKYHHRLWRPVTAIREADAGTGPSGAGDGNAATGADPSFTPLGAPASNLKGPNFTPPFPAYPSGHATFGAALFQTLRQFYGSDRIPFTFVSDEFNGVTKDNLGHVRLRTPRAFETLSQAEEENARSRIYLGIHWSFDATAGISQGRQVARYVADHAFEPTGRRR